MHALKRRLSDVVYRQMTADAKRLRTGIPARQRLAFAAHRSASSRTKAASTSATSRAASTTVVRGAC